MKIFLLFSMMFCCNAASFSQVWIDQGAEWHYRAIGIGENGFIKISYTADTVINGKNCQKLSVEMYRFELILPGVVGFLGIEKYSDEFTYVNGDTVFHYYDGSFYVLYNFGAQPGDTWEIKGYGLNGPGCDSASYVIVDSIGTNVYNGQTYRWISLSTTSGGASVGLWGKAIEKFGLEEGYLFPFPLHCDTSIIVIEFPSYHFRCYKDDSFPLLMKDVPDCEIEYTWLGTESLPDDPVFTVWPNPAHDMIYMGQEIQAVEIYNMYGELLEKRNLKDDASYSIVHLASGYYVLKLTSTQNKERFQKLVKY